MSWMNSVMKIKDYDKCIKSKPEEATAKKPSNVTTPPSIKNPTNWQLSLTTIQKPQTTETLSSNLLN